jgi:lysophospholipase L1-like esterase
MMTPHENYLGRLDYPMTTIFHAQRNAAVAAGIPHLNIQPIVGDFSTAEYDTTGIRPMLVDGVHLNDDGARIVAASILRSTGISDFIALKGIMI